MEKCELLFHGYTSLIARRIIVINDRDLIRLTRLDVLIKAERNWQDCAKISKYFFSLL